MGGGWGCTEQYHQMSHGEGGGLKWGKKMSRTIWNAPK